MGTGRVSVDADPVLATASGDAMVRLWDARTGRPRGQPLTGHTGVVRAMAFGLVEADPIIATGSWVAR